MARFDRPSGKKTIRERLEEGRRRLFVGREPELARFAQALRGEPGAGTVFYIYGPGGVGKSALLRQYAGLAVAAGREVLWLDGRSMGASPREFLGALAEARPPGTRDPGDLGGSVLFIDTYELITPLDDWLRDTFLPQLPEGTLVVLAGRAAPSPGWRTDLAWRDLLQVVALRNLRPQEGRRLLQALGVPRAQHDAALSLTYGHPLALVLLGDWLAAVVQSGQSVEVSLEHAPDAVQVLVERILRDVSDPLQRQALEICSHARGIYPHDLVRDAVEADLRWRNPEAFRAQHSRVSSFMLGRLQASGPYDRQRAALDLLYMHRHQPLMRPYLQWKAMGTTYLEPVSARDHDAILDLVRRHEGEGSARIAGHWLRRSPDAFLVVRGSGSAPEGFLANLVLHEVGEDDQRVDPALQAIWTYVQRAGPLRRGEKILVHRFWMGRDAYQDPGMMTHVSSVAIFQYVVVPGLAWVFPTASDAVHWAPMFNYFGFARIPEADFEVGGRRYGVFAHDLRVLPPGPWFKMLGERELASDLPLGELVTEAPPLLVLSEPQFAEAVRQALRDYTDARALAGSPLLRSRLVIDAAANQADKSAVEVLRDLLRQAVDAAAQTRRGDRWARALDRAFLNPAPSQEAAAELLDLPFSTFRYHLRKGIEFVTAWLWHREVDSPET